MIDDVIRSRLGVGLEATQPQERQELIRVINLKLATLGYDVQGLTSEGSFFRVVDELLKNHQEKNRLLSTHLCPVDQRIQNFIDAHLADTGVAVPRLPKRTLVLNRYGMGRELSLPADGNT
ncbi:MAG: hypothetical protein O3C57_00500, partial [Verrucomicrobia bacterium]|nr:hypothetical protein [Verrucomicrobiota bacterium]